MKQTTLSSYQLPVSRSSQIVLWLLSGVSFMFLFLALAAAFVLYFRPLYYQDISRLELAGTYGLSADQIRDNYDALIYYNSPFSFETLCFPDLPSSTEALIHFIEVKQLFMGLFLLGLISLFLLLLLLPIQQKRGTLSGCLLTSALTVVLLPALVGVGIAFRFEEAFVLFHKLFFRNDFWLFDAETDPIILLLPDTFFLHCAAVCVLIVLSGAFCLFLASLFVRKQEKRKYAQGNI